MNFAEFGMGIFARFPSMVSKCSRGFTVDGRAPKQPSGMVLKPCK